MSEELHPVESCPGDADSWLKAQSRFNCSNDILGRNLYQCAPNEHKTDLVEFCFKGSVGRYEEGLCLFAYPNRYMHVDDCGKFVSGCPNESFLNNEIYKYPACLQINREAGCYLADSDCPSVDQTPVTSATTNFTNPAYPNPQEPFNATAVVVSSLVVIGIVVGIILVLWYKKRCRENTTEEPEGISQPEGISLLQNSENKSESSSLPPVKDYTKDKEFQKRFQQYLEEGSVDVCPISQIIIVGENGVGKTTLLYRLQGRSQEEIDQIKSTRGIDCYTEKSGFIVTEGQLKLNVEGTSNLAVSPEKVLEGNTREKNKEEDPKKKDGIEEDNKGEKNTREVKSPKENERETKKTRDDEDTSLHKSGKSQQMSTEEQTFANERKSTLEVADVLQGKTYGILKEIHSSASEMNKTADSNEQPTIDKNARINARAKNTKDHESITLEKMSAVRQKLAEKKNTMKLRSGNEFILNCLDFAGQGAYYASHQAHLRKGAIYIIVFNASKRLLERKMSNTSSDGEPKHDVIASGNETYLSDRPNTSFSCWNQSDYINYWLNNIKVHAGSCTNIIFVGTHMEHTRERFKSDLPDILTKSRERLLLPKNICEFYLGLSRMNDNDGKELSKIKNYICTAVSTSGKKPFPAKWIEYERVFEIIKSEMPVIGIDNFLNIIDQEEIELWDMEIHDMLDYFHETGGILFFNTDSLREIIIVDIQWFVNCFKHIITDKDHAIDDHGIRDTDVGADWKIFLKQGLLTSNLYESLLNAKAFKLPPEDRKRLGDYQKKLGMMLDIKDFKVSGRKVIDGWYVPSVNTLTFKPDEDKYKDHEASSILCFKFKDYLPLDLFGRMVVLCLSSRKWSSAGRPLYKDGAHLDYRETGENNDNWLKVYLFTSGDIITLQILKIPKPKKQRKSVIPSAKHGEEVKREVQNIMQELLRNVYACSKNYETGILCSKKEGYEKSSVQHFISMKIGERKCYECDRDLDMGQMEEADAVWNISSTEDSSPNIKDEGEGRGIAACCQAYLKAQNTLFGKDMDFETVYISLLKSMDSKDQKELERLNSFVDIGLKLKRLYKGSNKDEEKYIAEMKDIACSLKKLLLAFDKERGLHLRRNFFFSWTDKVEYDQHEDILTIPEISLPIPDLKIGEDLKLEASVDIDVSAFIWLKKNNAKHIFEILRDYREQDSYQMRNDSYELKKFSKKDEGHYQLVVVTKQTFGRWKFQLYTEDRDLTESAPGSEDRTGDKQEKTEESGDTEIAQAGEDGMKGQMERPFLDEARFTDDIRTGYDHLHSVRCVSEERVWTCGDSNTMKLLTVEGQLLSSVQTKSGNDPYDITVTREGDLVYTDYKDRTINLVRDNKIRTLITLQGWSPLCVCCTTSGDLLVTMDSDDRKQSKVVRYSGSTETQTIQYDDQGRPLYLSDPYNGKYISENRNLDICVADESAKAVVVVNQSGTLRFRYTGHPSNTGPSFVPVGIATDSHSHILIADNHYKGRIHILDQYGQFLRYIHNLHAPIGLCVDSRDNLFVAEYDTAKVKRIQYLESQR